MVDREKEILKKFYKGNNEEFKAANEFEEKEIVQKIDKDLYEYSENEED